MRNPLILAALLLTACGPNPQPVTPEDIENARKVFCAAFPERCATPTNTPGTPDSSTPSPQPTPPSTPTPGVTIPTAAPTSTPTPQPEPTVTPVPVPPVNGCIDASNAPETPVSLAMPGGCKRWTEAVEWQDHPDFRNPSGLPLCAAISQDRTDLGRTSWRLGHGLGPLASNFELVNACGAWLQHHKRLDYYTDRLGRRFNGDCSLYQNEEDGPRSPWTVGGYSSPQACPTPTVPTPAPPTPGPTTGESCTMPDGTGCTVVCTVAFLGHNDRPGMPAGVEVGGSARLDITCRRATQPGDSRGQPVDRFGPEHCEPSSNPVLWEYSVPGGVDVREFNDGYGLALDNLQAGTYRIEVKPKRDALDRKGQPITWCPWGHGSSTRTVLEFSL